MNENQKVLKEKTHILSEALLCLKTTDELDRFLSDMFTFTEMEIFAQRLEIAECLYNGKTIKEISLELGTSSATIGRVKQAFLYGEDGYKIVIERLRSLLK